MSSVLNKFVVSPFIFSLLFLVSGCIEEPDIIKYDNFEIDQYENNVLTFHFDLTVNNPNNFKIKLKKADFNVKIEDELLGEAKLDEKLLIASNQESIIRVPITIKLEKGAIFRLLRFARSEGITITIDGLAKGSVFCIPKKVKVKESKEISLKGLNLKGLF